MRQISYRTVSTGLSKQHILTLDGQDLAANFNTDVISGLGPMLYQIHGIDGDELKKFLCQSLIEEVNRECYFQGQNELNKHEQQQIIDIVEQLDNPI